MYVFGNIFKKLPLYFFLFEMILFLHLVPNNKWYSMNILQLVSIFIHYSMT